jgi:hypothetical protein
LFAALIPLATLPRGFIMSSNIRSIHPKNSSPSSEPLSTVLNDNQKKAAEAVQKILSHFLDDTNSNSTLTTLAIRLAYPEQTQEPVNDTPRIIGIKNLDTDRL